MWIPFLSLVLLLACPLSQFAFAESPESNSFISRVSLQPEVAATYFTVTGSDVRGAKAGKKFGGGLLLDIDLRGPYAMQTGLLYLQEGTENQHDFSASNMAVEAYYISLPILIRYRVHKLAESSGINVKGGLAPAFLVNSQANMGLDGTAVSDVSAFDLQAILGAEMDLQVSDGIGLVFDFMFDRGILPISTIHSAFNQGYFLGIGLRIH